MTNFAVAKSRQASELEMHHGSEREDASNEVRASPEARGRSPGLRRRQERNKRRRSCRAQKTTTISVTENRASIVSEQRYPCSGRIVSATFFTIFLPFCD